MEEVLAEGEPEQALELFFTQVVRMPADELERYRQLPVWQRRIELASTIPRELALDRGYAFDPAKFAGLGLPVILLLGGDSPELFQSAVEVAHEALVNSEVVLLPGQQHIAMDTDPELFVTTVLDCLTDG